MKGISKNFGWGTIKKLIVGLLWTQGLVFFSSGAWAWQATISGTGTGFSEQARAVAVDAVGNVVAAGFIDNAGTGSDFTVAKFDGSTGAERWRRVISNNAADMAHATAVDAAGNVVVAGSIFGTDGFIDFTVIKFDGVSGNELWRKLIRGSGSFNEALAVTVDTEGNVVAAGRLEDFRFPQPSTFFDFTVIKFDGATGTELWRQVIHVSTFDMARAVTVDPGGNVLAAGYLGSVPSGDFAVIKFDGTTGVELWRRAIPVPSSAVSGAFAVTVDGVGNVVATGEACLGNCGFTVMKFHGATGVPLWSRLIHFTGVGRAVTVDVNGDVVAAGITSDNTPGSGPDFTVIKLNESTGAELWRGVINGTDNHVDEAHAVTVDAAGDVVAAGFTTNVGTFHDLTFVKFAGATGAELWRRVISGTGCCNDEAFAVAVDGAGNVAAAGFTENSVTFQDFTVIKISGADGGDVLTPPNQPPTADAGGPYTVAEGGSVTLSGSGSDPDENQLTYAWDLDNNETFETPGQSVSFSAAGRDGPGSQMVVLKVCDNQDACDTSTATVNITNVAPTATFTAASPINEGNGSTLMLTQASDPSSADTNAGFRYSFACDGLDSSLASSYATAGTAQSTTCPFANNGSFTVKSRVFDKDDGFTTYQATVVVNNVAPAVGAISAPTAPVQVNMAVGTSATFTDAGVQDTHTATWSWGDGTSSPGTVTENNGSGSVTGSHTYTTAGVYTVTLTVTADDGGSGQSVFQFVVVFDPAAGFVTGAGSINSPPSAYVPNPSLTGTARFGFVSRYQQGANVPTGQTGFHFLVANFHFRSTTYAWLVIAGARAQYRGTGTINGAGSYDFILTGIDGEVSGGGGLDKFRIKIFGPGGVVYDNQMGAGDDVEPTTVITSGSVVIHR